MGQSTGDLFGRPAVTQALGHIGHERPTAGLGASQVVSSPDIGTRLGRPGIVSSGETGIAFELTADGATVPAQTAGGLGLAVALPLHSIDDISLVHGKMMV